MRFCNISPVFLAGFYGAHVAGLMRLIKILAEFG